MGETISLVKISRRRVRLNSWSSQKASESHHAELEDCVFFFQLCKQVVLHFLRLKSA